MKTLEIFLPNQGSIAFRDVSNPWGNNGRWTRLGIKRGETVGCGIYCGIYRFKLALQTLQIFNDDYRKRRLTIEENRLQYPQI
jgi:hypothetical protein